MKKLFAMFIVSSSFVSCSKDDSLSTKNNPNDHLIVGTWQLTSDHNTSKHLKFYTNNLYQKSSSQSELEFSDKIKYRIKGDTIVYAGGMQFEDYYLIKNISSLELKIQMVGEIVGNHPIYEYKKIK